MELLWRDIRLTIRSLRTNPGFALIAILTLALGIGFTTAIFSVVNAVLLQPLPLDDPSRLIVIWEKRVNEPDAEPNVASPRNVTIWGEQSKEIFSGLAATFDWEMNMTGHGDPELVRSGFIAGPGFDVLGAKPYLGKTFKGETLADAPETEVVLSWSLWQRKFGGQRDAIGKQIQMDGVAYTIVGVMPREFFIPNSRADIFVPYPLPEDGGRYMMGIARLAPGVSLEEAQAQMKVIASRTEAANPRNTGWGVTVIPAHEQVTGKVRRTLFIVLAAVALLLVIGCVNIANLLLSRATARQKEMAVRAAIGASRGQIVRQLLTESIVLAIIGGILGVILAGWGTMLLVRFTPESVMLPRMTEIAVDRYALAVAAFFTLGAGILFGLVPALQASRTDLHTDLKSGSRGSTHDRRGKVYRNSLVVLEMALATVLLIGAGLLIKTFANLESIDLGVRSENVLTTRVVLSSENYTGEPRRAMVTRLLEQARSVPGVERVGAIPSLNMPFTNSWSSTDFIIDGAPTPPEGEEPGAHIRPIAGDYFRVMGIPILSGRVIAPTDETPVTEGVEFVVNDAFSRKHFAGKALGRRITLPWGDDLKGTIVGIVGDVRIHGPDQDAPPAIYISYGNDERTSFTLLMTTSVPPQSLAPAVTKALRAADPLMPVSDVKPLETLISGTIARPRFNATMFSLFAALGLVLASVGIYGVLSYSVAQRRNEMGIRMALGADQGNVLRLVVGDGTKLALLGVATGIIIALVSTRVLSALLYGVEPADPAVFTLVGVVLLAIAVAASLVPALRATRVDPMIALRPE